MRIVVTGAQGFIGRNLQVRLTELGHREVVGIHSGTTAAELEAALATADAVFHLAGVNRPGDPAEFERVNAGFTARLVKVLEGSGRTPVIVFASSTQAALENPYGASKRAAEALLLAYGEQRGARVHVFRLTNVFGKWSRPHYNSVVATFCHQITRGLPIVVNDTAAPLRLVYIDDVVAAFVRLRETSAPAGFASVEPVYETTVGEVAAILRDFADSRRSLVMPRVGAGLTRALYATYLSHLPPEAFAYELPRHADARGVFVEMLKTPDCGQFSYLTAGPGITRGGHYHHSKSEKFLVLQGTARFAFRHILTQATHEIVTRGGEGRVVETVPGWTHDITNVGSDELIVMLWANEIFDQARPDTVTMKVAP